MVTLPIAFVDNSRSPVVKVSDVSFSDLLSFFESPDIGTKDGVGWIPAQIPLGPRAGEHVVKISFLVLDVESKAQSVFDESGIPLKDEFGDPVKQAIGPEPPDVDLMAAELETWNLACLIHTTYSHGGSIRPAEADHPRYRLIFPLSRPIQKHELKPLGLHVAIMLGLNQCFDEKCLEPARLFYLPRCPSEARLKMYRCELVKGDVLKIDSILEIINREKNLKTRSTNLPSRTSSVIKRFNEHFDLATLLEQAGYIPAREGRWIFASSTTGQPGVRVLPDLGGCSRVYSSHGADPLNDGHAHDAFDVFRITRHNGAFRAAIQDAAKLLNMNQGSASNLGDELGAKAWKEPGPIQADPHPVAAFDADTLLPEVIRSWVVDEASRMPCPTEYVAVGVLVCIGALIGSRCGVKPKQFDSWVVVPNLWGGIIGEPAAKKSPAMSAAFKPLEALINKAATANEAAKAQYETDLIVYNATKKALEEKINKAAKIDDDVSMRQYALDLAIHREQIPTEPVAIRYKTNDTTIEKLGELLRDNPQGLIVIRDELVGLIATWDREGREGERAFFLEAWNGTNSFDTDRIGRGHIYIQNLCCSIFGGIQPDKLLAYLDQAANALANDGMLQRFQLLVYPDPVAWRWTNQAPDLAARNAAFDVIEEIATCDPVQWGASEPDSLCKLPVFRFSEAAQVLYIKWATDLHTIRILNEESTLIKQHLGKYEKLAASLALIFHLVDCAQGVAQDDIGIESMLRALGWCEFLEGHARRIYGLLLDGGLRSAQTLATKIKKGRLTDGFTLRDVRRHQWHGLTSNKDIEFALLWLEDEDWIRGEEIGGDGPGSGRPTTRYTINPKCLRTTEKEAA
jgi:hypothetical protein